MTEEILPDIALHVAWVVLCCKCANRTSQLNWNSADRLPRDELSAERGSAALMLSLCPSICKRKLLR